MNLSWNFVRKRTVILLVAAGTLGLWVPQQINLSKTRAAVAEARNQLNALDEQIAQAQDALEAERLASQIQRTERGRIVMDLAKAKRDLEKSDPDSRWINPPLDSPEWNPESPYVWLRKEMMARLPVSPFAENGELQREIAYVMTIDAATQRKLNGQLKRILDEYRTLEAAKAERLEEHLPGISGEDGDKLTVRVQPLPEEGARLKLRFESALIEALGEQRTGLLLQTGDHWIDSNFAQFGSEPKTISVLRKPNGTYNVSIGTGGRSWMNTGGPPADIARYHIPPNLRPMFAEFFAYDTSQP
jgi:hypothetical protein